MSNLTELIPVVLSSMLLVTISHWKSVYNYSIERYRVKDAFFYTIMAVILIVFAGLRTRYNDTRTYLQGYDMMDITGTVSDAVTDWSIGANPGFVLLNSILKHQGVSDQSFLMFYSALTLGIYFWFLRKYTNNIWLTTFLFITFAGYIFTMAAIKQCVAVAFCLLAIDQLFKKRYVVFLFWVLVATIFHPYAIMYLLAPFLMFRPWSIRTYLSLVVFGLAGILLQSLLGAIVDVTSMFGEGYDVDSFSGEGVNPFRLAVCAVPLIISFIARHRIAQMDEKQERTFYLFTNLTILNAEIMFVALFGTANYFARLANYFLVFQALSLPWLFQFFDKKSRQLLVCMAVVCFSLLFYYANAINQNFNADYDSISLIDYLLSLF